MTYLLRAALIALSLATITPVANAAPGNNAAPVNDTAASIQQDWANG